MFLRPFLRDSKSRFLRLFLFFAGSIALPNTLQAQEAPRQPAIFFPVGHTFCDTAVWKLVFEDDFEEATLKKPWIRFTSWASMPGGDHDNWSDARKNGISIYRDKNVVIQDGVAHLQAWKEPDSWRCDTCTAPLLNTEYSTAILALPYTHSFHSGRFEARLKMPAFKWAHSTFWTWLGSSTNEIDIAEGYGISKNYLRWATSGKPYVNYSLHSWPTPEETKAGAVHEESKNRYPAQEGMRGGGRLRIDEYHVYACEWDTAVVRFFLDGELVSEQWKYNIAGKGSGCRAAGGVYTVMPAFPRNNQSYSNLRFTIAVDKADRRHAPGLLGEMEIDYVRIWQRHPERKPF
jgi:hypothetical protein